MERHEIALLFADLSGTTRLFRRIGTSEAQRALERCVRRMERAIDSHGGSILMPAVDEMIASFPLADSAVQAAIEMQERIADLPPASGVKLSIRIGVHFGNNGETPESLHGEAFDAGRALLNIAGPHQIVADAPTAEAISPALRRSLRSMEGLSIQTAAGECQLYELCWLPETPAANAPTEEAAATPAAEAAAVPSRPAVASVERFCIRVNGKAYLVDERSPTLTIGRDKACDVVIGDRKASRQHVRIEKRGSNRFFLVDQSMNGTFVAVGKDKELCLHHEEMQLSGRGRFAFGHSTVNTHAEIADFEAL